MAYLVRFYIVTVQFIYLGPDDKFGSEADLT
jgi:hypothetical protein